MSNLYLEEQLNILVAGRCAEKILFDTASSGAVDDLQRATKLAKKMIAQWGMSDVLGPVGFEAGDEHPFLGKELAMPRDFSESTAQLIDQQVFELVKKAEKAATVLLQRQIDGLKALQQALLDKETIDHTEIASILALHPDGGVPLVADHP